MEALSLMLSYVLISSRVTSYIALLKGSSTNYYIDIQKTSSYLVLDKQCDQGLGTGREARCLVPNMELKFFETSDDKQQK